MARVYEVPTGIYQRIQEFPKKYEAEFALAEKLILCSVSLIAVDIFNIPSAKEVKKGLTILKSVTYIPLGITSAYNLMTRNVNNVNEAVRNFFSALLVPFTLMEATSFLRLENWEPVHAFFKASPVLSHMKFAGITNLSISALLSTFAFDSYAKRQKLEEEKVGLTGEALKKHEIKIIQNNWSLVEKTAKVASSVFSFVVLAGSFSHPAISAVKIGLLTIEIGLAVKKYQCSYLVPEPTVNVA